MAVNLSPFGGVGAQFLDNSGNVLTGGKIFTYAAGTTTNQATYTSSLGNTPLPNPIILNAAGRVPTGEIWLTDGLNYKFVLTDSNDVLIATYDNINGINSNFVAFTNEQEIQTATAGQTVFNLTTITYQTGTNSLSVFVDGVNQYGPGAQYAYVETDSDTVTFTNGLHVGAEVKFTTSALTTSNATNATVVAYDPPFTGAVGTNVAAKLAQTVSVKDFGAVGDGTADDSAAIQAAINYASTIDAAVYAPAGIYFCDSSTITVDANIQFYGDGMLATEFVFSSGAGSAFAVSQTTNTVGLAMRDFTISGDTGGKTGLTLGTNNVINSTVDARFQNIRIFQMSVGINATYAFKTQWDNVRVQSCTQPASLGNQVNATLFNDCAFVSYTSPLTFTNCEGIQFNSCDISNSFNATSAISMYQSSVTFVNPYFEFVAPILATVGNGPQAVASVFIVEGGILLKGSNSTETLITYQDAAVIKINGLRVKGDSTQLKVANIANVKSIDIEWQYKAQTNDELTKAVSIFSRNYHNFEGLNGAFGGLSPTYNLYPDYLELNQINVGNGVQLGSLVVGNQYTMLLNVRRGTTTFLSFRGGNILFPTTPLSIVGTSTTEFQKIVVPFVASETVLRLIFQGTLDVKEIGVFEGVIGKEGFSDELFVNTFRQWQFTAAPTVGTWKRGDVVWNVNTSAGGSPGWVCTTAGTPGTWKAMAGVAA